LQHKRPNLGLIVKLCSDKAAFEARPIKTLSLDMSSVRKKLETSGQNEILIYTPYMIILRNKNIETTLSKDGRMLIKRASDEAQATQVAQRILTTILKP
jgi:hypothetical protein